MFVNSLLIPMRCEIEAMSNVLSDWYVNPQTTVVFPKAAKNGNNEWLFVVQDEQSGFKQGVRVENCGG